MATRLHPKTQRSQTVVEKRRLSLYPVLQTVLTAVHLHPTPVFGCCCCYTVSGCLTVGQLLPSRFHEFFVDHPPSPPSFYPMCDLFVGPQVPTQTSILLDCHDCLTDLLSVLTFSAD